MGFISACQSGNERRDFVPGFARYNQLAFLNLGGGEIQGGWSCIHDNRKSGDTARSLEAPRPTLDRLGFNTGAIELLLNVSKELEPT